jgi:hypothetical protein
MPRAASCLLWNAIPGLCLCLALCFLGSCSKGPTGTNDGGDGGGDGDTPSIVADLAITAVSPTTISLSWTAPNGGDPKMLVYEYDLRYATFPISDTSWGEATGAEGEPAPLPPGMTQVMELAGLSTGSTYWIALEARSTEGVWSGMSNVVSASLPAED